jgi:hypothetical protein
MSVLTNHGDLTNKCSNVDQKVVAHVDAGVCNAWVHNDALAVGFCANVPPRMACLVPVIVLARCTFEAGCNRLLLGNEWRYASLEEANTCSKEDQANDKRRKSALWRSDYLRNCGDKNENVSKGGYNNRNVDSLELAPVLVGQPSTYSPWSMDYRAHSKNQHTNHRHNIREELVELYKTRRSPLTHAQSTWLTVGASSTSTREWTFVGQFSLDEVHNWIM